MYCPSCGQQQVSNEIKFCSRCGMPLTTVAEVVHHGGFLPQLAMLAQQSYKKPWFSKKNGVVFGALWFIFLTMFCTAFFGILGAPEEFVGIIAITGVFGAMMIIIGSLVMLPSSKPPLVFDPAVHMPQELRGGAMPILPAAQTIPVDAYAAPKTGSWRDTSDLTPNSVTESTTRLLEKQEDRS
jgi:hypothetical protein